MFKRKRRRKRGIRRRTPSACPPPATYFEALETRVMLTTVFGGEVFQFRDANFQTVQVVVNGDPTDQIELIGATEGEDGTVFVGELAGTVIKSDDPTREGSSLFGGIAGRMIGRVGGIQIIAGAPESPGSLPHEPDGSELINIQAIASRDHADPNQRTWGFHVVDIKDPTTEDRTRLIQLLRFSDDEPGVAYVEAQLHENTDAFPPLPVEDSSVDQPNVTRISAADFDPSNPNLLYFTATRGDGEVGSADGTDRLYVIDVDQPTADDRRDSVIELAGNFGDEENNSVSSIAFDREGASSTLYAMISKTDDATTAATTLAQVEVSLTNETYRIFFGPRIEDVTGNAINNITGIEFTDAHPTGDATAADAQFFAITSDDENSRLYLVDLDFAAGQATGRALGVLPDPDDNSGEMNDPQRGQDLQGLAWSPTRTNPFTGQPGTLLATDATSDELVAIDTRTNIVRQGDIFQIYVAQSDEDTSIAIAVVNTIPNDPHEGEMLPFQGIDAQDDADPTNDTIIETSDARFDLLVTPTEGPAPFAATFDAGVGGVYLGGRVEGLRLENEPDGEKELIKPVTRANLGGVAIGVRPPGLDDLPGDPDNDLVAGIIVAHDGSDDQNINRVLIGGKVTGRVDISGSIDTFYAGALLTGKTDGQLTNGNLDPQEPGNFRVGGDLRNLIVRGSIGTHNDDGLDDPRYVTGFDMIVDGKIGQVVSQDSYIGSIFVNNQSLSSAQLPITQQEIEIVPDPNIETEGTLFQKLELWRRDGGFGNGTFDSAQYVGTVEDPDKGGQQVVEIIGQVSGMTEQLDLVDYYALGLLAGQTVTVELTERAIDPVTGDEFDLTEVGNLHVGVFDPDGRLVASNDSNVDRFEVSKQAFQFTADRPGAYRFAVATFEDVDFNAQPSVLRAGNFHYRLKIEDAGDVALGGLVVTNNVFNNTSGASLVLENGDLGAVAAGGILFYEGPVGETDIHVMHGGLRSIVADQIGLAIDVNSFGPNIQVDEGDVGLIRSTGDEGEGATKGLLNIESAVVGGDLQWIDAAGTLFIDVDAGGGVGVVRAQAMNSLTPSVFNLNTDQEGRDGIIDLIDVAGDFGTLPRGGPQITAGPGGNIRYIRVGGDVFQDEIFGGGTPTTTRHAPGTSVTLTDDSGAIAVLSPIGNAPNPDFDPAEPGGDTNPRTIAPSLDVTTYGIRDGGVVILEVASDAGVSVRGRLGDDEASVEVTRIVANGVGRPVELRSDGTPRLSSRSQTSDNGDTIRLDDLNVNISQSKGTVVDIFEVIGGNFTNIHSSSTGELVNVTANSIETLASSGTLGLAKSSTGAAVVGREVVANNFPFVDQRTGIVSGHIVEVRAHKGLGNLVIDGVIGQITANADRKRLDDQFEGINAPVYATGDIFSAQIGQGIAPSGSGAFAGAGLFSDGSIFKVANQGPGSDIRGDIVAQGKVGRITLTDGSIINADIMSLVNLNGSREQDMELMVTETRDTQEDFVLEVGPISVTGNGGIIGAFVAGPDIGRITVRKGFGILNSEILTGGEGVIDLMKADGLGIRGVSLTGGATAKGLTATGKGQVLNVQDFSSLVRLSENFDDVDPLFGTTINRLNDLHRYLNTSAAKPDVEGKTNAGVIDQVVIRGSRNLGKVLAYAITDSTFDVANSISTITVRGDKGSPVGGEKIGIKNLNVLTGELKTLKTDSDVNALSLNVRGKIDRVDIDGDLLEDSVISTSGISSDVNKIVVKGDVDGNILVSGTLRTLDVRGDINGNIVVGGGDGTSTSLNTLKVGGAYANGTLVVEGNVGTITVPGSLGTNPGLDQLVIRGNLKRLRIGSDRKTDGSRLALDLTVLGDLGTLDVQGKIIGSVNVQGDLKSLKVTGDEVTQTTVSNEPILSGDVKVAGTLRSLTVKNGDVSSLIEVGQDIKTAAITNGTLQAGGAIRSAFGDVNNVKIKTGRLHGEVAAENGQIRSIRITGDGADLGASASIKAQRVSSAIRVAGSVLTGAEIAVSGTDGSDVVLSDGLLKSLTVNGDVQTGVSITAGTLGRTRVDGDFLGNLTVSRNGSRAASVTVRGDLGGTIMADSDMTLSVKGDVTANGSIWVGQDLTKLTVTGDIRAHVIVSGHGGRWSASNIEDAVITTGFDLSSLTAKGSIMRSLIQAGMSPGDNHVFDGDMSETSRMVKIGKLSAAAIDDSVIAAGGAIDSLSVSKGTITNSSVSTGFTVGSEVVSDVLDGTILLALGAGQDAARSGSDRNLFHGTFGTATVNSLVNSDLTAGVDGGDDGQFGTVDDSVLLTHVALADGGGYSQFKRITVKDSDATSNILADSGFAKQSIIGAANRNDNLSYDLNDPIVEMLLAPNQPYSGLVAVGTASNGSDVVFQSSTAGALTVSITGVGTVQVLDDTGAGTDTDNSINTLIISGTTPSSKITLTNENMPGGIQIARILGADDAKFRLLSFDGVLAGDGTDDVDLWLDGGGRTLELGTLGAGVTGQVGGDVTTMTLDTQDDALLRVAGDIKTLNIDQGLAVSTANGIIANSISRLNVTGTSEYLGHVSTTGNSVGRATFAGGFGGELVSSGAIGTLTISGDVTTTAMISGTDIKRIKVLGNMGDGEVVAEGNLKRFDHRGTSFDGTISAYSAGRLDFDGGIGSAATIGVVSDLGKFRVDENFGGSLTAGWVSRSLDVAGSTLIGSTITANGDAKSIRLGGTQGSRTQGISQTTVNGHVKSLTVKSTHNGQISARLGVDTARFEDANGGLLAAGLDIRSLKIRGRASDSVFSAGTWIGQDGLYNTADDLLTGGSIDTARVTGQLVDSVIAAGVLPSLIIGPGIPLDKRTYVGNPEATTLSGFDSAEAGGTLVSRIGRLTLTKDAINTSHANGQQSAIVAADGIGRTRLAATQVALATQTYGDPFGAPEVVSTEFLPGGEKLQIVFSEPVNSASLIISTDANMGTVTVQDIAGNVINNLTGTYTTRIFNGVEQGVLTISSSTALPANVSVEIAGRETSAANFDTTPTIFDRSGLRSVLRDFNQDGFQAVGEDFSGTIPDGDGDATAGGDFVTKLFASVGDTFADAQVVPIPVGTKARVATNQSEVDVYKFDFTMAGAFEYFSAQYLGRSSARMALFLLDDQGTPGTNDDIFEIVARWEFTDANVKGDFESFMAFEMPQAGEYYLVVSASAESSDFYSLNFARASTDQILVDLLGGILPRGEQIAYVSNLINQENNTLGANEPKQLVYVNFGGGASLQVLEPLQFAPFDVADFDVTLAGGESDLIHGNSGDGVTGIMENLTTIFTTTAASHPAGMLNVQLLDSDLTAFVNATEGLFFTTVDPITSGLDPSIGFSTIFVGTPNKDLPLDLLGLAGQVDLANLDKSDDAFVVTSEFQAMSTAQLDTDRLNEYSRAFANVIAHELGHILGLNHQPTDRVNFALNPDDPDNNPGTGDDGNGDLPGLMAYTPNSNLLDSLHVLGTAPLPRTDPLFNSDKFPLGHIDTADLVLRWLT